MGRDPHRAPGRLAPLRPDYERGRPAQPPLERPPVKPTVRLPADHGGPVSKAPEPPPDYQPYPDELPGDTPPAPPSPAESAPQTETPWRSDDTQPRLLIPTAGSNGQVASETRSLSIHERYEILTRTIRLYSQKWRLAGIQANHKTNRLQAYLLPRSQPIELKEAISRDLAMFITVDPRGNIMVKEPKKHGLLARIKRWLLGE